MGGRYGETRLNMKIQGRSNAGKSQNCKGSLRFAFFIDDELPVCERVIPHSRTFFMHVIAFKTL
jgi:hypothetical protein